MRASAAKNITATIEQPTLYSINEVAELLGVSEATVRNWVKLELLSGPNPTNVTKYSIEKFIAHHIGTTKLTGRANKSRSDFHDHNGHVARTLQVLLENPESAATLYENGLSNSYRNKEGIYYTPDSICNLMLAKSTSSPSAARFCDPCCGTGNFLIAAINAGFLPENVYGFDTDQTAVEIARSRVKRLTGYEAKENILVRDSLTSQEKMNFSFIATNPPWGKKLSVWEKNESKRLLGNIKPEDSCSLFLAWAMQHVSNDGCISLLLPDSFFNIAAHEVGRKRALEYEIVSIENFGRPFKGLMVGAVALTLKKTKPKDDSCVRISARAGENFSRSQSDFLKNPKSIINFNSTQDNAFTIASVMEKPHVTLKGNALWGLGIVTGDNSRHCRLEPIAGDIPVYRGTDITCSGLKPPSTFISSDLSKYQQVASRDLYFAPEKIIYRFISSKIVCLCDKSQCLILNSANFFIPSSDFPVRNDVLSEYLNSDLVNWIFSELFRTHKVLRGDLEAIPIFTDLLSQIEEFDENRLLEYLNIERIENGTFRVKREY